MERKRWEILVLIISAGGRLWNQNPMLTCLVVRLSRGVVFFFFLERWIWCGVQVMNQNRWYIIYISKMGLLGCCAHEKDRDKGYLGIFEFVFDLDYSVTWWRVLFFLCSKWQVATCRVYTIRRLNKKIKKEERQFGVGGHIFNMV